MKNRVLFILLAYLCAGKLWAFESMAPVYGEVDKAQNRIGLAPEDFQLAFQPSLPDISASVVEDSVHWVRHQGNILLPRALVVVRSSLPAKELTLLYRGISHGFQQVDENVAQARFYVSLFENQQALLYSGDKRLSELSFEGRKRSGKDGHMVDYSCYGHDLETSGLEGEYLSLGCSQSIIGEPGQEKVLLQVLWAAPNWKPIGDQLGLRLVNLKGSAPAKIQLISDTGEKRDLLIKAKVPLRKHRAHLALGFGPYQYLAQAQSKIYDDATHFMYMLYGKFDLTEKNSFKLFDAYIEGASTFNNFGFYFSSDVAKIWDERLVFNTLLGFQDLLFDLPGTSKQHKLIYPQGIEMILNHPFDLKNYKLMAGGFVTLGGGLDYSNVWLRFGKNVFYELNYLKWAEDDNKAEAFGLSVGIPLFSLF